MIERGNLGMLPGRSTRRQVMAGGALALGGLALSSVSALGQQTMTETASTGADKTRTSIHQEVDLKASPHRIYEILLDSKLFSGFSGEPATIDPKAGGTFTMFGNRIEGRNIELVADQRIVQAWRAAYWEPGYYTVVRFEIKEQGTQTHVVLDHTGFHEGQFATLSSGWKEHYWDRMTKYLAG
jgi:activator of HSP90 ATPase